VKINISWFWQLTKQTAERRSPFVRHVRTRMIWVPNLEDIQPLLIKTRRKREKQLFRLAMSCRDPSRPSLSLSLSALPLTKKPTNQPPRKCSPPPPQAPPHQRPPQTQTRLSLSLHPHQPEWCCSKPSPWSSPSSSPAKEQHPPAPAPHPLPAHPRSHPHARRRTFPSVSIPSSSKPGW
jgi:hypothetical protein